MELKGGKVTIELRPDLAPKHVERIRKLTKEGFYNGLKFHRVIEGFMAQTGDPTGTGMGGSELGNLPAEFTSTPFERGTVGAARARDPNSANSQFFICFNDTGCKSLVGNYTVFGKVTSGMEFVDQIKKGDRATGGTVVEPGYDREDVRAVKCSIRGSGNRHRGSAIRSSVKWLAGCLMPN